MQRNKKKTTSRKLEEEEALEIEEQEGKEEEKKVKEGNPLERLTRCYRGVCQLSVIGPRIQLMNASPTACTPLAKTILALRSSIRVCVWSWAHWPWPPQGHHRVSGLERPAKLTAIPIASSWCDTTKQATDTVTGSRISRSFCSLTTELSVNNELSDLGSHDWPCIRRTLTDRPCPTIVHRFFKKIFSNSWG